MGKRVVFLSLVLGWSACASRGAVDHPGPTPNGDPSNPPPGSDPGGPACQSIAVQADSVKLPVDILWVIDNSSSMWQEESYVQNNLNTFSKSISAGGVDHHVILISDAGHIKVPPPLGGSAQFLAVDQPVDSHDAFQKVIATYPKYQAFLRPNAKRHIVVVSDDESNMPASTFEAQVAGLSSPGFPSGFTLHAIVAESGPVSFPANECFAISAARGAQYIDLQVKTGGVFSSECQSNWTPIFTALSQAVVKGVSLPCHFSVPPPPSGQTLDFGAVNLVYTPSSGGATTVPNVSGASSCPPTGGWYYDDPSKPTELVACPSTCSTLTADTTGKVEVAFGCKTLVL